MIANSFLGKLRNEFLFLRRYNNISACNNSAILLKYKYEQAGEAIQIVPSNIFC